MTAESLTRAEEFRKQKKYDEAAAIFRKAWEHRAHPDVGWRLAHCLRHSGRFDEALTVLDRILEEHPDEVMASRESIWCVYSAQLQPAVMREDLRATLAAAERMLALGADEIALLRAVFSVVKVAKAKRAWQDVLEWTSKLEVSALDKNPRTFQDRSFMAEREQWYFLRLKALIETRRFDEALELSGAALKDYADHRDFSRWHSVACAGLGNLEQALEEIQAVAARHNVPYILDTLASLAEQAGKTEDALRASAKALLAPGKLPTKIKTIERFARLSLEEGHAPGAVRSCELAVMIREEEGWTLRSDLEDLSQRSQDLAPDVVIPPDFKALLKACRHDWDQFARQSDGQGQGTIDVLPAGRPFCFIKTDDGQEIFSPLELVPEPARRKGAKVDVSWVLGHDRKRNRPALRATHVRLPQPAQQSVQDREGRTAKSSGLADEDFRFDI